MTIFISQGGYTNSAFRNMIENPKERWENARKLVAAAGGELLQLVLPDEFELFWQHPKDISACRMGISRSITRSFVAARSAERRED